MTFPPTSSNSIGKRSAPSTRSIRTGDDASFASFRIAARAFAPRSRAIRTIDAIATIAPPLAAALLVLTACSSDPASPANGGKGDPDAGPDPENSNLPRTDAALADGGPGSPSGWPDATNTGYKNAPGYPGSLTPCPDTIRSGQTYRFCEFADGAAVGKADAPVTNVHFYGCRFRSNAIQDANVSVFGDGITFDYSSFEPSKVASPPAAYELGYQYGIDKRRAGAITIDHSDFWGFGNGIQFGTSSQDKPLVVRNSWFHDTRQDGGKDHTDAILCNDGGPSYMVFDHNRIVANGNTNGLALQFDGHPYDHVTITNNYFSGFGITVNTGGASASTNMTFVGNTFGTDIRPIHRPLYGDEAWTTKGLSNQWRSNRWHVVPGSYYEPKSDDGKYWWPDGTLSTTDYTGP